LPVFAILSQLVKIGICYINENSILNCGIVVEEYVYKFVLLVSEITFHFTWSDVDAISGIL